MIAHLRGILAEKEPHQVVVDVGGVGYRVFIPLSTFERLPGIGEAVHLVTVTHVREDAFLLHGFATAAEREVFVVLNSVTGIGARLAMAALSTFAPDALVSALAQEDVTLLARIPGIGKRIAMRLVVELKDRLPALPATISGTLPDAQPANPIDPNAAPPAPSAPVQPSLRQDLISALVNLGYRAPDAERVLRTLPPDELSDPAIALRAALKILSR
ncbi:Holliday junction ATP-dependent DNA helicase RuvA [Candidatus Magnetaquicoccaceae bacterium FCR-1]|uniref:Holliday junction branch migration complex subunit RuvA n=1 Tax=Candidatus Magnetaquiglobus chichijimensis TaxID=3141448 RepID=A0ABQ0CBH9_9PROT